jgi:uncharacterized protein YlbG (UPF0298 family)
MNYKIGVYCNEDNLTDAVSHFKNFKFLIWKSMSKVYYLEKYLLFILNLLLI